ncbi:MAG: HAD family phosphatase [Anaerolineaceae bacterium]|nr:HAD family phosphatase [Anaerolineaceae bacterium]
MKKMIKAIIFDMGGVLLRTIYPTPRESMARRFGITRNELERYVFRGPTSLQSEVGLVSDIYHWQTVLKHFKQKEANPLEIYKEYFSGDAINQELLSYAESLKPEYEIGLLSNAWVDSRNKLGLLFHFIDIFDIALFSAEEKVRKPEEEFFRLMLNKLKVRPDESIFIDDFVENIEGANKIGMNTILFKNTHDTIQQINALLGRR